MSFAITCPLIIVRILLNESFEQSEPKRVCRRTNPWRVYNGAVGSDLIFYQFNRSKVERMDFRHFLGLYAPDKLPTGRRLREMMNCFVFCIEGRDNDPREIHMIAEIRRFYSAFHEAWPYWLYFCNLDVDTLRAMVACCLSSVNTMQVDGKTQMAVTFDTMAVLNFLKQDFLPMNLTCERAEMFEERIYERTKAVFQYFGLPFDDDANRLISRAARQ
jgi:hypothetical protein